MNILYLADPNSIHDIKWMSWFSSNHNCFLIVRKHHLANWNELHKEEFFKSYQIEIIENIEDFSIRHFYRTFNQWRRLKSLLKKYDIDVFHVMYAEPNSLWGVFRQKLKKCKWVLTTRGTDVLKTIPNHFAKNDLLNKIISQLYKKAINNFDLITCTSYRQVENINKLATPKRVEVIRTGVDVSAILQEQIKIMPEGLQGQPYLFFPRNMQPLYNHEFSIASIKLLPDYILNKYKFVFVDRNSNNLDYVRKIERLISEVGIEKFVFLPRQSQQNIFELYKKAAVVIMNPLSDGAPVSAMEALLCGRPLILGNLDYDQDIFGGISYKIMSWNPKQFAELIEDILNRNASFDSQPAIKRISQKANREIEMERLHQLYNELNRNE